MPSSSKDAIWIEDWAKDFAALGVLGFLFAALILGRILSDILQIRGKACNVLVIPTAIFGGFIGTFWFISMGSVDPPMATDLNSGLSMVKSNLVTFLFTAFLLGLTCTRTSSQHLTGFAPMLKSVFHEGMPMVLYSQIIIWGQSAICLFMRLGMKIMGTSVIPPLIGAMVPLGMESGPDVVPPVVFHSDWSQFVVQEAESYSLLLVTIIGVVLVNLKGVLYERGWLEDGEPVVKDQLESFRKGDRITRTKSAPDVPTLSPPPALAARGTSIKSSEDDDNEWLLNEYDGDKNVLKPQQREHMATFGTHMSIIFLTAFCSFLFGLFGRVFESKYSFFQNHNFVSGFCLFEVSMCFAFLTMQILLRHTRIVFNRDWFMRICGVMLDLLVVASLASAGYFPSANALPTYTSLIIAMIIVCALWNIAFMFLLGRYMFPNFWYDRCLVLMGDSMGHAFVGLLFARCLDPTMETPVPAAFAYKLMFIFLPTSAGKNSLVFSLVQMFGLAWSFVICVAVMGGWLLVFRKYYEPRFVRKRNASGDNNSGDIGDVALPTSNDNTPVRRSSTCVDIFATDADQRIPLVLGDSSALLAISPDIGIRGHASTPPPVTGSLKISPVRLDELHDRFINFKQKSMILSATQLNLIASWLPESLSLSNWKLVFSLRGDGANLSTMLAMCNPKKSGQRGAQYASHSVSHIIIVEDSWGYSFGGFIAHSLVNCNEYYGSGENFVFSVSPLPKKYPWTGENDLFVVSSSSNFAMGGGGEGFAFQLDDELATGVSNRSRTYNNNILSSNEFFKCLNVELWQIDDSNSSFNSV